MIMNTVVTGTAISIHSTNEIRTPSCSPMNPMAMMLGGRAHRRRHAADRAAVGGHQHQRRAVVLRQLALGLHEHDERHADWHEHGGRGGVAHPGREERRERAVGHEDARRAGADEAPREHAVGDALVHAVHEQRLRQDEAADEEKDQWIRERRENIADRRHPQHDGQGGTEQRGDRQRQRLGGPEDDDQRHDRRQPVPFGRQAVERQGQHYQEQDRTEQQADPATHLVEPGLGFLDRLNVGAGGIRHLGA